MFTSDDEKWRAITTRDPAADGVFVYAVRTTRIYCRPNCKARLARRANVRYYADCRAAEAGGFRACKRCKPRTQGGMPEDEAVARIRQLVATSTEGDGKNSPSLLASEARVSRWHFHRKFKEVTGVTPRAYLKQRERERRETTAAAGDSANPSSSSGPSAATTTTTTPSTDSDLFDISEGTPLPDLSLLLAETERTDQPFPALDFTPAELDANFLSGLDPVFLDPTLWGDLTSSGGENGGTNIAGIAGYFMDNNLFSQDGEVMTTSAVATGTIPSTTDNLPYSRS
ncbi:hypothetical protein SEUCBS139899_001879 [Sporothrix eucalyptigena]|uniref:HTH araC/xylS-type domain-containing protein n=1 Tax=Sporothrix eucalyptigena TaxID=1812306 RepID=A0ABP0BZF4_9PEZI